MLERETPENLLRAAPKVSPDSAMEGAGPELYSETTPDHDLSADLLTQAVQPFAFELAATVAGGADGRHVFGSRSRARFLFFRRNF